MKEVILVVHLILAIGLIGVILLQKSEGGALGIGGGGSGGGGMSGFLTGRGAANLLTRVTAVLAALFIATSMVLAILSGGSTRAPGITDRPGPTAPAAPANKPAAPAKPATPAK
jgi:preprotein translocase subunit SecG